MRIGQSCLHSRNHRTTRIIYIQANNCTDLIEHVLVRIRSASSRTSHMTYFSVSRTERITSESARFIWQPCVSMKNFLLLLGYITSSACLLIISPSILMSVNLMFSPVLVLAVTEARAVVDADLWYLLLEFSSKRWIECLDVPLLRMLNDSAMST